MPGVPMAPHPIDPSTKVGVINSGVRTEHPQIGNAVGSVRILLARALATLPGTEPWWSSSFCARTMSTTPRSTSS